MSHIRTFRQLLSTYQDSQKLFDWLFEKHTSSMSYKSDKWTAEERVENRQKCQLAYVRVIQELLHKKPTKRYPMAICVKWTVNYGETERYLDATFLNPKYVAPKKGLKPWGGKNPPKGHYNCNANRHNQYFAFGYEPWSKIIDTPVVIEGEEKIDDVELLGAILWELTFHGWSEKECNTFTRKLNRTLKSRMKEIKKDKNV